MSDSWVQFDHDFEVWTRIRSRYGLALFFVIFSLPVRLWSDHQATLFHLRSSPTLTPGPVRQNSPQSYQPL